MIIVDAHCDSITEAMDKKADLFRNQLHIDLERLSKIKNYVQFFAAFVDPVDYKDSEMMRLIRILDHIDRQEQQYGHIFTVCRSFDEIGRALTASKVAAVISVENGGALKGDLSALRMFYRLGVRSICLTWNYTNEIADGIKDSDKGTGLTAFGREVVSEMNRLGMLVDVSHLSEKSFWDVIEATKAPIIASHSNAKAICRHPRNLNDEQLLAIKANNGAVGINLYPFFLNDSGVASMDDIIMHIEHIVAITGEDHIGLGTDYDGIECLPDGICGIQDTCKIFDRLLALNYSQDFVEKFAGGNFMRVMSQVMK